MDMEDRSSKDIIEEYARITRRVAVYNETPYKLSGVYKFVKYRKFVYLPYDSLGKNYFVWVNDPLARIGYPTVFSGAFIPISSRIKSKLNIRSRNILDKLSFLKKSKVYSTGSKKFDSRVVIKGSYNSAEKRLLSQPRVQDQLLKALEISSYMTISINEYNVDFIPELKGKSYLSIINPQGWELESDSIDEIFRRMEKIRNIISYNE